MQRDILLWDYHSILADAPGRQRKGQGMQRVPTEFQGLHEYCGIFRVLLLEELKAHLLQVVRCYSAVLYTSTALQECSKYGSADEEGAISENHCRILGKQRNISEPYVSRFKTKFALGR